VKATIPKPKILFLPYKSASRPKGTRHTAEARRYAVGIQVRITASIQGKPKRGVFRSSFPGRCNRRPGPGTTHSRPYRRDPACCSATSLKVKKAQREVSSRSGFRRSGIPSAQRNPQQGFRSPCRTQDKENQKEAWDPPLTPPCPRVRPRTL
jgi:hypothetical protein